MNKSALLGIAIAGLIATPAIAQTMSPGNYVKTAGASDLYERTASRIVLQTTANPKLRHFAEMMITAHTKSTEMVKAAAMRSGLHPKPPMLMPDQSDMIAKLRAEKGADRDATYIEQQKMAHDQALSVQMAYSQSGTAPALKMAATKIVPVVQQHIAMLKSM